MTREGNEFVDRVSLGAPALNDMYCRGILSVRSLIFDDGVDYGKHTAPNEVAIDVDDYLYVHGTVRAGIRDSSSFRTMIASHANQVLVEFGRTTSNLCHAFGEHTLKARIFGAAVEAHARAIGLIELRMACPYKFVDEELRSCAPTSGYTYSDFAVACCPTQLAIAETVPFVYARLLHDRDECAKRELDREWYDFWLPVQLRKNPYAVPYERFADAVRSARRSARVITRAEASRRVADALLVRRQSQRRFLRKLAIVGDSMPRSGHSETRTKNLLGQLAFISVVATLEETRHVIQDRFWWVLNGITSDLELPKSGASIRLILDSIRQRWG